MHVCSLWQIDIQVAAEYDNAAWLVGIDALTHPGPARLSRVSRSTCGRLTMPAVDPAQFVQNVAVAVLVTAKATVAVKPLPAEPALRSYAR